MIQAYVGHRSILTFVTQLLVCHGFAEYMRVNYMTWPLGVPSLQRGSSTSSAATSSYSRIKTPRPKTILRSSSARLQALLVVYEATCHESCAEHRGERTYMGPLEESLIGLFANFITHTCIKPLAHRL